MKRGVRVRAFALVLALAGLAPAAAGQDRAEVLALLHDGRFDAARTMLRRQGPLTRPDDLFFDAFTTYWRLVFDDENPQLRVALDGELDAAIAAAEATMRAGGAAASPLWAGSSHLLLAELRASQRRPMAAAFEAKKAKRLLESPAISGAESQDAAFALGTYNYLADIVPNYVKGLRAILFLPKGNRSLGLKQLADAASSSRFFAFEARGLLITFYSGKHERLYARAIEERNRLLEAYPDAIASSYASARLDVSLGRYQSALDRLARAEARARRLDDVDPAVARSLDLLRARAELAAWRPDLAGATVSRALASGAGLSPSIREDFVNVRQAASRQAAGIPWPTAEQTATPALEAETWSALAAAHPDRPILALLAGDASLRAGGAEDALTRLSRASASGLPADLQAGCRFRQGQAQDLLGKRSEAIASYASVASTSGFVARDGAFYYQQSPYGKAP